MEIKKLMKVLVLGGAAIATTQCGPAGSEPPDVKDPGTNSHGASQTDGGTKPDGGVDEGGGPEGW